jgi:hypothetical protein
MAAYYPPGAAAALVLTRSPRQFSTDHLERLNRDKRFGFSTFLFPSARHMCVSFRAVEVNSEYRHSRSANARAGTSRSGTATDPPDWVGPH